MGEEHENGAGLHDGFDENEDVSEDELVQIEDDGAVSYTHLTLPTNREV